MRLPVILFLSLAAPLALAAEPGNLWDVTTSMEMGGMKMPGRTQQVCAPVNAEGPEAMASNDECQMSNIRRSPGKFSYDVACPNGSGTGEMTYQGRDNYTSKMTMTTDGQTMTMVMTGKKVGSCDASVVKKQVAAAQAQAAAGMEQACAAAVSGQMPASLDTYSCDPKYKRQLCSDFGTKKGFSTAAARQPTGVPMVDSGTLPNLGKFCGVDPEGIRSRLCNEAGKTEDLAFIASACPALAQPIAQRECAGRTFSSPPAEKYRDFCSSYASGSPASGDDAPPAAPGETPAVPNRPADLMKEGAKRLKGLFGG
ncbi:MAG: DUF3617 family protein [Gammaproteobacteria bacterium]|nr:DUF3617 family protein [Gammaproteobacteria bacterium]